MARPTLDWGEAYENAQWAEPWMERLMPEVLRQMYMQVSTLHQDQREATDYVMIPGSAIGDRWAVRVRSTSSCGAKRDITIRCRTSSGAETEIHKLHHVDNYLFAWIDAATELPDMWLAFRVRPFLRSGLLDQFGEKWNRDRRTAFKAVPWTLLHPIPGCVLCGYQRPHSLLPLQICPSPQVAAEAAGGVW